MLEVYVKDTVFAATLPIDNLGLQHMITDEVASVARDMQV
jgi:hypothetical protein